MSGSATAWQPPPELQGYEVVPMQPPPQAASPTPSPAPSQDAGAPSWMLPGYDVVRLKPPSLPAAQPTPYAGPGSSGGYLANFLAGAAGAFEDTPAALAHMSQWGSNTLRRGWNAVTGDNVPIAPPTDFAGHIHSTVEDATGYDPNKVPSPDFYSRLARGAGAGAAMLATVPMGSEAGLFGRLGAGTLMGAEGEVGKEAAEGAVDTYAPNAPGWVKTGAGFVGSLAAPMTVAAAGPTVGRLAGMGARATVPGDTGTQGLLDVAQQHEIPVSVAQMVRQGRFLRTLDTKLRSFPLSGYGGAEDGFQKAVNSDVNDAMGLTEADVARAPQINPDIPQPIPIDSVTPDHIRLADSINGGGMGQIVNTHSLRLDQQLGSDLRAVLDQYGSAGQNLAGPVNDVRDRVSQIVNALNEGSVRAGTPNFVPGTLYQNLTQFGSPLIESISGAPNAFTMRANNAIKQALDDAWHRSLPADQWDAWQNFRANYANTRTVEPLLSRADDPARGIYVSTGDIVPDQLRGAVNKKMGPDGVAYLQYGDSKLNDLARLMQRAKETRGSGTPEGEAVVHGVSSVGGALRLLGGTLGGQTAGRFLRTPAVAPPGNAFTDTMAKWAADAPGYGAAAFGASQVPTPPQELVVTPGGASWQPQQQPIAPQGAAGPTVNPATGQPQFNLADAQRQHSEGHAERRQLADAFLRSGESYRQWLAEHKADVIKAAGGQAIQHLHRIGAALQRRDADGRGAAHVHHVAEILAGAEDRGARQALTGGGLRDMQDVVASAMNRPDLAGLLARNRSGGAGSLATRLAGMV